MKGVGKTIELEKLNENLSNDFTERTVSSSILATSRCGHLCSRIQHDRPFPAWQRNILLWWASQFVHGCICVTERLFLLFGTTAHPSRWKPWNNGKKTWCWTSGFPWELTDVFQNIPLVCERGRLPVVKTGVSIQFLFLQWRTLRFAFAASKEIMFSSLWDHINCSSSNGSFLLLRKCAGSGSLCQGYRRKLYWRWEECTVPSIQYSLPSRVQKRHGKCHWNS